MSPVVTSLNRKNAVVWVFDVNVPRSASLYGEDPPKPVLYAVDAVSMELLWRSAPGQLYPSGKYNEPLVTDGKVFVGTDRIQIFGLGATEASPPDSTPNIDETVQERPKVTAAAIDTTKGLALYEARCAACHDQERPDVPSRSELAKLTAATIADKLMQGSMQGHTLGLDADEVNAIAHGITASEQTITPP